MCNAIDKNCRRSAGVRAAVKHKASINLDNLSVRVSVMTHKNGRWVTVHMPKEAFLAAVLHFDRTSRFQRKQTTVNLKTDVFACTECAANAAQCKSNLFCWHVEACRYLCEVFVQPLSCYVEMQPETVWIGDSECGLEAKKRLILHANDVFTFNDNCTRDGLIATDNALMTDDVSIRVNRVEQSGNGIFWVGERSQ